jgi:fucose permease
MTSANVLSRERLNAAALSIVFGLTGTATVLPGAALPLLLKRWSLHDNQAAVMFLLLFVGSSCGALLARGVLERALLAGAGLLVVASFSLAIVHSISPLPFFALYGMSLGLMMTSISLIRSRQANHLSRTMNFMNLLWSFGAVACPALLAVCLRYVDMSVFFRGLALCILLLTVSAVLFGRGRVRADNERASHHDDRGRVALPLAFAIVTALSTGVESAVGSWLSTYVQRLQQSLAVGGVAIFIFWGGLFFGRAVHSTPIVSRWKKVFSVGVGFVLTACGLVGLVLFGAKPLLLLCAGMIGFGIGPVYPILLSIAVRRYRGNYVFLSAGIGASFLPWLTGILSSRMSSLRVGMLVPMVASIVMVLFSRYVMAEEKAQSI